MIRARTVVPFTILLAVCLVLSLMVEASEQAEKSAIETITPMRDKDGKWRVSGYFIK